MLLIAAAMCAALSAPLNVQWAREAFDLVENVALRTRPSETEWKEFVRDLGMSADGSDWILDRPDGRVVAHCLFAKEWTRCGANYSPKEQLAVPEPLLTYLLVRGAVPTEGDRIELHFPDSSTDDGARIDRSIVVTIGGARLVGSSAYVKWVLPPS